MGHRSSCAGSALRGTSFLLGLAFSLPLSASAQSKILACESPTDACREPGAPTNMSWTINGTEGVVDSVAGSHLTIERMDAEAIEVHRSDESGPTAGLSAVYRGFLRGTRMIGTVEWNWPGHPEQPAHGSFSVALPGQHAAALEPSMPPASSADGLPRELLVCEDAGPCGAAWTLNGTDGAGIWFARNPTHAILKVVRSAPDDIRINRTDTTDNVTAVYIGRLRGDHYGGTVIWSSPGHPGSSSGSWTATVPQTFCNAAAGLDAPAALAIGQTALMFHHDRDALGCYTVAAGAGDARAQTAVGLTFYQGRNNVPQDYAKALYWLRKAADQGVYNAQRTVAEMYKAGLGTPRDQTLSEVYTARADEQKHDMERQQELEEKAADRRAQVLSSFVLGASFGLFF